MGQIKGRLILNVCWGFGIRTAQREDPAGRLSCNMTLTDCKNYRSIFITLQLIEILLVNN
jgi:hypothetical protein